MFTIGFWHMPKYLDNPSLTSSPQTEILNHDPKPYIIQLRTPAIPIKHKFETVKLKF